MVQAASALSLELFLSPKSEPQGQFHRELSLQPAQAAAALRKKMVTLDQAGGVDT